MAMRFDYRLAEAVDCSDVNAIGQIDKVCQTFQHRVSGFVSKRKPQYFEMCLAVM
jgi:hypothetical protein